MKITADVRERLARMSLAEKVGQVFVFTWRNSAQAADDLHLHPGGFIRIYSDALTVARETAEIQAEAAIPLIIAADFERGIGGTVSGAIEVVSAMALGATGEESMAYDAGRMIGEEASVIGVNMDYAPDLDVNSNPKNPVINTRSFGENPENVGQLGVAFMRGLQAAGVAACGKHFPGHGNTSVDSHNNLGSVPGSKDELLQTELMPFKTAIEAGIDAIMSAHLLVPAIEPDHLPATLSRRVMTGLLRQDLGFEGVAVTDALDMGAIVENFGPETAIPGALNAGCDQLIMPHSSGEAFDILISALRRGEVSEDRLNEAVARILTLKGQRGIFNGHKIDLASLAPRLNTAEHRERTAEIAEASIALVRGADLLPLQTGARVFCVELGTPQRERSYYLEPRSFADHLATDGNSVTRLVSPGGVSGWHKDTAEEWREKFKTGLHSADVVVLAVYAGIRLGSGTIGLSEDIAAVLRELLSPDDSGAKSVKPVVLASFGSPYVISDFPEASVALCAFSETQASQRAMARVIRGEIEAHGTAPVKLDVQG